MAIIKPSLKFEGSELNLTFSSTPYIKEGVRKAVFNKNTNPEGAYLFFLPAYRADSSGNGVWFKKISVRDNFGTNFKEKYHVANRAADPAEYFANNFRVLYNEESKVTDQEVNGKKFKKYPNYGRVTDRVMYNVAFSESLGTGAHVLDLPLRNGADILMNWLDSKDRSGRTRQPINDPDRCVPVFVKLKENSANPWMIQVENDEPSQLPRELADSDYLYNLDDIFTIKTKDEIIAKLREMYSVDVFDNCMNGYPGLTKTNVSTMRRTPAADSFDDVDDIPMSHQSVVQPQAPKVLNIPKAVIAQREPVTSVTAVNIPSSAPVAPVNLASLPPNPMAAGRMSREEALRFINEN